MKIRHLLRPSRMQQGSQIQNIAFIAQLFPMLVRQFYPSLQKSKQTTSLVSLPQHLVLLACEMITQNNIMQTMRYYAPNIFWVQIFIVCFFGLVNITHFGIAVVDMIMNYGLLMRFTSDLPMSYYISKAPMMFDETLPNEGQPYKESMGKAFLKHLWDAYQNQAKLILLYIAFLMLLVVARLGFVLYQKYLRKSRQYKAYKPIIPQNIKQIISSVTVCIFFLYLFTLNGDKLDEAVPAHWYFYRSAIKRGMPRSLYLQSIKQLRENTLLPDGEDWLDQRDIPTYPLVHGSKRIAAAYNKHLSLNESYIKDLKTSKKVAGKLPNVVVLVWESFTPAPKYVTDRVLKNKDQLINEQPFRRDYLPYLAKLAEDGHTFLGVRSNGIPTINGWHALVTGEVSNSHGVNMIGSYWNDVDDFPTKLKQLGFYSLVLWPCGFQSDKNQNYIFRGKKMIDAPEFAKNLPEWFDEIHNFYPTYEEAQMMGIKDYPKKQQFWTNDRLSSQMFNYFFNQQVKNQNKPVFGFYGNVDTHEDFSGFDDDEQYEEFKVGVGRSDLYTVYGVHDGYSTVLKYSDRQFGRIYENIRKNAQDTIIVVLGDHASRQVPIYLDTDKRINDDSDIYYDLNCNYKTSGADQQFMTSAVMAYYGKNPVIKEYFDKIKNKTSFEPTDHQDVIQTLFEILEKAGAEHLPSARLGQNMFEQVNNLINQKPTQRNPKVSTSHFNMEYSDNDGHFRFNLIRPSDGYQITKPLPSCIAGKDSISDNFDKKKHTDARRMLQLTNYLVENNRVFNYKFRDLSCLEQNTCTFPTPNQPFRHHIVQKMFKRICNISIKLTIVAFFIASVAELLNKGLGKIQKTLYGDINVQVNQQKQVSEDFKDKLIDFLLVKSNSQPE